ncbi:hypothetical protein V5799_020891 [Amblyomma americanum]|uniref:Uncharacterized protein n=1 Tax=Amblyomma americanum TaxID=6943 RepID=A0AAQ4ET40_AMBAM
MRAFSLLQALSLLRFGALRDSMNALYILGCALVIVLVTCEGKPHDSDTTRRRRNCEEYCDRLYNPCRGDKCLCICRGDRRSVCYPKNDPEGCKKHEKTHNY